MLLILAPLTVQCYLYDGTLTTHNKIVKINMYCLDEVKVKGKISLKCCKWEVNYMTKLQSLHVAMKWVPDYTLCRGQLYRQANPSLFEGSRPIYIVLWSKYKAVNF